MSLNWDQTRFDEVLNQYLKTTTRTVSEALNNKAYFIARKALWLTHKARSSQIKHELGRMVTVRSESATGRIRRRQQLELREARNYPAPLAALIVQKQRKARGEKGLYGSAMEQAIRELLARRLRSVAFIKSGWIPAIRKLEKIVTEKRGAAGNDTEARQYGADKGDAEPAGVGLNVVARIINSAKAKGDDKGALERHGGRGLDLAFYDETQSMMEYIERKMKPDTDAANERLK